MTSTLPSGLRGEAEAGLPLRVLLVAGDPADARLVQEVMRDAAAGAVVLAHESRLGPALERFRAERFDAVLLDLSAPDSEGLETFTRTFAEIPHVPIIVLTGPHEGELAAGAMREGAQDCLVKAELDGRLLVHSVRSAIERKRAEEALRESGARYRLLFERHPRPLWVFDSETHRFLAVNEAAVRHYGYSREEFLGMTIEQIRPEGELARLRDELATPPRGLRVGDLWRHRTKQGRLIDVEIAAHDLEFAGRPARLVSVTDVTERRRAEERVRLLTLAVEQSPAAVVITDRDAGVEYVNRRFTEITGYELRDVLGRNLRLLQSGRTPARVYRDMWSTLAAGQTWQGELVNRKKDGELYWNAVSISPLRDASGEVIKYVGVEEDVTERKVAEETIRESERRFREVTEHIREVFFLVDLESGRNLYVSPAFEDLWGFPASELDEEPTAWLAAIHPDDRRAVLVAREANRAGVSKTVAFRIVRPDGSLRWARSRTFPVRDADGEVRRLVGFTEDITSERELESQLRQAQKMEAVGRLAGGVAHDFNNLLTAISGFADLVSGELPPGDPLREDMEEIRTAAQRATALTRQLLAFSRQQMLAPRVLELNDLVRGVGKMLHRVLGEDVELETRLAPDVGNVKADPGQLEQVIVNLAVNARDAMPGGGTLTIETATARLDEARSQEMAEMPPGPYAVLAVTDAGHGMDEETRARVFEPFFTTKEVGRGTGLGLSTVYGIVKQSGGFIWVYSEPEHGTTFKIYLPSVDAPAEPPARRAPGPIPRGDEVVMLVEDEEAVRRLAERTLTEYGYEVVAAASPAEALGLCEQHASRLDLLVTDLVMPGMGGAELARRVRERCGDIAVLFISGWTDAAAIRNGYVEPAEALLEKPFTPVSLARRVREVLDRAAPSR